MVTLTKMRKKKAVSTIVATILMINTAVGMGVIYLLWTQGIVGVYTGNARVQYDLMESSRDESIVVENVWFGSTPSKNVTIFVRNIGIKEARIEAIYTAGQVQKTYNTTQTLPYTVRISERVAFRIVFNWNASSAYLFSVVTARGNKASGQWIA